MLGKGPSGAVLTDFALVAVCQDRIAAGCVSDDVSDELAPPVKSAFEECFVASKNSGWPTTKVTGSPHFRQVDNPNIKV